jgi:hypothetical protein
MFQRMPGQAHARWGEDRILSKSTVMQTSVSLRELSDEEHRRRHMLNPMMVLQNFWRKPKPEQTYSWLSPRFVPY